jgi:hypothetical protein
MTEVNIMSVESSWSSTSASPTRGDAEPLHHGRAPLPVTVQLETTLRRAS